MGTGSRTTRHEVLVVNDDPDIRHALRALLEGEEYTVHEAADGQQALERLRTSPRRLVVLLDLQMPQMDGVDVVERVATQVVLARHTYILVTGRYGQTMPLHFANLVAQLTIPVITKPFDLDKLLAAVEAATTRLH